MGFDGAIMAKKTITTTEEVDGIEEGEAREKLDDDVIRALTELDGAEEIRWQVHRVSNPNPGFCPPEMSTSELSLHQIATLHGPGRYRIKGIKQDGTYYKSARVTIAESMKKDETANLLAALKGNSNGDNQAILLAMMQQNTAIVSAALAKPERASSIPWAAIVTASPLFLAAVKDFFKNTSSDDAMEKLVKQLALVEKLRGDDKKEGSNWTDIIRDALPSLQAMVSRPGGNSAQPVQHIHARVTNPPPATVSDSGTVIETPEAVEPTIEMLGQQWLDKKISELVQNASENKNPELRAEVFVDDMPAYIPESLVLRLLNNDDWFQQLSLLNSAVIPYSGWFTEFRECLIATLSPDGDDINEKTDTAGT